MTQEERRDNFMRLLAEASVAKDRLGQIAGKLEELGYIRKSKSCITLCQLIEEWQSRN